MCDKEVVRRIFKTRARVVVYVESEDVDRMEARARGTGRTLIEWARERLLDGLADDNAMQGTRTVRLGGRGASAPERPTGKTCKHGIARHHHCWQCGGVAVIE